jgi:hypothetical protein
VPAQQRSSSNQYFLVPDKTIGAERRVPLLHMNMNPMLTRRISLKQSVPAAVQATIQYVRGSVSSAPGTSEAPLSPRSPIVPSSPRQAAQASARAVTTGVHRLAAHITGAATSVVTVMSPKQPATAPRPPGTERPSGVRAPARRYENSSSGAQS